MLVGFLFEPFFPFGPNIATLNSPADSHSFPAPITSSHCLPLRCQRYEQALTTEPHRRCRESCLWIKMENVRLKLYDSIAQQEEVLKPKFPGNISVNVCGVTTHHFSHLCHACAAVAFDV